MGLGRARVCLGIISWYRRLLRTLLGIGLGVVGGLVALRLVLLLRRSVMISKGCASGGVVAIRVAGVELLHRSASTLVLIVRRLARICWLTTVLTSVGPILVGLGRIWLSVLIYILIIGWLIGEGLLILPTLVV